MGVSGSKMLANKRLPATQYTLYKLVKTLQITRVSILAAVHDGFQKTMFLA